MTQYFFLVLSQNSGRNITNNFSETQLFGKN